jgi:hypothetical protein
MKKRHAIIASAALLLVGCANDETVVNNTPTDEVPTGAAIDFNLTVPGQTRSTLAGSDAATKLNNEFVVYGIKHTTSGSSVADQDVFQNYLVKWTDNTAGTTESNTNNWEYVGVTPYVNTKVSPVATSQTVKYWDYSADKGYTFTAFSGKNVLAANTGTTQSPIVTKTATGYTVNVPSSADLSQIFFSDRVTVAKTSYDKPVVLTFRNFGSKIRVGFYETVPGYKVTIDKFYTDSRDADKQTSPITTFNDMKTEVTGGSFVAAVQNVKPAASNKANVSYYDAGTANENQAKVGIDNSSTYQYTLALGTNIPGKELGTNATGAIWDNASGDHYTIVYPNLENVNPMLIRCDYTLTSEDGSGETIKVKNARVTVPTQYVQWKSNYAYTYLFKISNNTNGTTGNIGDNPDDPTQGGDAEGLYPITFDAVVMEATDFAQETTTTVATNSVTSYAKDGYKANNDIYFVNHQTTGNTKSVIVPTGIADVTTADAAATKASVYSLAWSNTSTTTTPTEGDVIAQLTGLKNGLTLKDVTSATATGTTALTYEVPSADGTTLTFGTQSAPAALKFTPNTAGNYAYIYCTTKYVAPTYAKVEDTQTYGAYTTVPTFYFKTSSDVYFVASGITAANFDTYKSQLYTQTAAGTAGVYDVKVITVAAN